MLNQQTLKVPLQPQLQRLLLASQKTRLLVRQLSNFELDDEDYDVDLDEIDLHRGYSRPKLITVDLDNDEVSDYVALRLQAARVKALEAFRGEWG
jgi:hypothetical protein